MSKQQKQIVTAIMVSQYIHLEMTLAQEIFEQLNSDSLEKAQVVIGLPDVGLGIAWAVNKKINNYRKENGINLECRMVSTIFTEHSTLEDSSKKVTEFLGVVEIYGECFLRSRRAVFAGYKFDNPEKHPSNAPWKYTAKARKSFELLAVIENPSKVGEWMSAWRYKLCQSVILPVPREQYIEFIKD